MKIFYILTLLLAVNFATGQNWGDRCDATTPCTATDHLVCQHPFDINALRGTCVCKPGTERYGTTTCRAVLGEACAATAPGPLCTDNAACNTASKCECKTNFFETPTGTKRCRANYSTICTTPIECNEEARMECLAQTPPNPNICKCRDSGGYTEWSQARSKCVSKIGDSCTADSKNDDEECIPNAICSGSSCQCVTGYVRSRDGKTCHLRLGETCNPTTGPTCSSEDRLVCNGVSGKCECGANYVLSGGVCRKKARDTCDSSSECLSNRCELILTSRICLCQNNQIELDDKTCGNKPEYCYVDGDCDLSRFSKCDKNFAGTPNPRYGKCTCTEGVDQNGKCVNKAGSACTKYQNCVDNAECIEGVCQCMDYYLKSEDGYCRPSNNMLCQNEPCSSEAGLICNTAGTCGCPSGQEWLMTAGQTDSWVGHCVAFVGGNCTVATNYCVENANCSAAGVCECKTGYSHTYYGDDDDSLSRGERRCMRKYDEVCSESDPCNPGDFLTCPAGTGVRKCECLYGSQQVYDKVSQKCKGLSGAFCGRILEENSNRNASCVPNADCVPDVQGIYKCKCFGSEVAAGKDCTESRDSGASSLVIMSVFTLVGFSKVITSIFN